VGFVLKKLSLKTNFYNYREIREELNLFIDVHISHYEVLHLHLDPLLGSLKLNDILLFLFPPL
jgi:hypothetical protein